MFIDMPRTHKKSHTIRAEEMSQNVEIQDGRHINFENLKKLFFIELTNTN